MSETTDSKQVALARALMMDELATVLGRHFQLPFAVRYNAALAALQVAEAHQKEGAS